MTKHEAKRLARRIDEIRAALRTDRLNLAVASKRGNASLVTFLNESIARGERALAAAGVA